MRKETMTHKIVRLAIFLAMGIVLNIVESMIPLPIAIPGIRLGLANTMGLIVLYFYSPKEYVAIGFLRVFIVTLIRTGFGSMTSILSFSGWFLSTLITLLIYFLHKASVYGLSVTSAMFHQVGQIIMVMIIYELPEFINYLPVLLISAIVSGLLVAFVSSKVLSMLNRVFRVKSVENV
ncbi:MAG: Gx transporter family protein [Bacilli bacterium]|nr:Gx transporter family protein [Bacilli bacterium]